MTSASPSAVPRGNRGLLSFAILAATVLAAVLAAPRAIEASHQADFERYYTAAHIALRGGDIYALRDDRQFKYLPAFALFLTPLAAFCESILPPADSEDTPTRPQLRLAAGIWYAMSIFAYALTIGLAISLCSSRSPPIGLRHPWLWLVALAFSSRFLWDNLRLGQVNVFAMFFACLAIWLIRRRQPAAAGICAAIATVLKHMPALLFFWFLLRREWRAAGAFAAMLLALVFLAPILRWGPANGLSLVRGWFENRHKMVTKLSPDHAPGQSIPSLANRFLRPVNAAPLRDKQPFYINITACSSRTVTAFTVAAVVLVLAMAGLSIWRSSGGNPALEAGLLFLLMLLISPESRKAHFVYVLVPAVALGASCFGARKIWLAGCLIAAFVLLALSSEGVIGRGALYLHLHAYGCLMWAALLLAIATVVEMWQRSAAAVADAPQPGAS